jgi:hypothetical protein
MFTMSLLTPLVRCRRLCLFDAGSRRKYTIGRVGRGGDRPRVQPLDALRRLFSFVGPIQQADLGMA